MLDAADLLELDTLSGDAAKQHARQLIERLSAQLQIEQTKLKFEQSKNQALNIEVMRLKQWRFGSSSESMESAQTQLFDTKIEATLIEEFKAEDRAADEARKPPKVRRQAKRQPLPAQLERMRGANSLRHTSSIAARLPNWPWTGSASCMRLSAKSKYWTKCSAWRSDRRKVCRYSKSSKRG